MLPVPGAVLKRLNLEQAVLDEARNRQSLMPPAPGWEQAAEGVTELTRWLRGQLQSGLPTARNVVVSARKFPYGVRPIPVWGFAERIAYRALVDFILRNQSALDRSAEAYLQFVSAPVTYARDIEPKPSGLSPKKVLITFGSSVIHHVVQTDMTAFYEYVDHGILSRELLIKTGDNEAVDCLMNLLAEVQGRTFGLPQLLDSSDRLSDVYIDIVERDMLRRGWPTWRFNDDFRIATRSFGQALAAIEDLAAAAREVGLTLNDAKTITPRYGTYLMDNFGLGVDQEAPEELRRMEPEDAVGDYTEGVGETDPTWAFELIAAANAPDAPPEARVEGGIDIGAVRGGEMRRFRRALGRVTRAGTGEALQHMVKLVIYVPALTPWIVRYVIAAGQTQLDQAVQVLDEIIARVSLSDWQRVWVVYAFDQLGALTSDAPGDTEDRKSKVADFIQGHHTPIVAAQSALGLATVGAIEFDALEYALRYQPSALISWYLAAISRLRALDKVTRSQYAALRGEGGLFATLLPRQGQ